MLKQAFVKSWLTTLIGVILLLFFGYKLYLDPDALSVEMVIQMLVGLGFIVTKDATASHTKGGTSSITPPPGTPPVGKDPEG